MTNYKAIAKTVGALAAGLVALALNTGCVSYPTEGEPDNYTPRAHLKRDPNPNGFQVFNPRTMRIQNESPEMRDYRNTQYRMGINGYNFNDKRSQKR
jgi:hypothetical protein